MNLGKKSGCILILTLGVVAGCLSPHGAAQYRYGVKQRWVIGGDGSWDYMTVDTRTNRLYVAHQTTVQVIDLASGKLAGTISGLTRSHGIVIVPSGGVGFISDGGANNIVVFDPASLAKLGIISAGANPDGMVYEPVTQTLWAFNGASKSATVVDVAKRSVIATVPLPGKPEFPTADGEGAVFVNLENLDSILRIDAKTRKVEAMWKLAGCESPSGLAFDRAGKRLFSVCDGRHMAVTDARTGVSLATPPIGDGPDATAYDEKRQLAFSSNEDGTLTVIDAAKPGYPVIQSLATMKGARTMALDAATGTIYTVSAKLAPPPPTNPPPKHPRPIAAPGTFTVLVIGRE